MKIETLKNARYNFFIGTITQMVNLVVFNMGDYKAFVSGSILLFLVSATILGPIINYKEKKQLVQR